MTNIPRGASMAVFKDGKVLLVRRAKPPFVGIWSLPGGMQKEGETPAQAAVREVREETGIEAANHGRLAMHHVSVVDENGAPRTAVEIEVFYGTATAGMPVAADDADAASWVAIDRLDNYELTSGASDLILAAAALLTDKGREQEQP